MIFNAWKSLSDGQSLCSANRVVVQSHHPGPDCLRELDSLALWLKESKAHHSSNFKSSKKRYFYRIIAKHAFAHTALSAYSVMLCNRYPDIQVCKKCAKMCRRAKQSPMDKSITGFMAGFRTSEQTPFDIEMRFTMNKLLSCRYNMDTNRVEARFADGTTPVSYTHLTLPTTPYV